jgi:hypothetical protein
MRLTRIVQIATIYTLCLVPGLKSSASPLTAAEPVQAAQQPPAASPARPIGTIKAIASNTITLASDAGPVFNVTVEDSTRLVRIEPGEKDLKNAQPLQLRDLQVGDRILVTGKVGEDGHSVAAASVIAMKKADVDTKQQHDLQDWQRRGVGGLVSMVDSASGTITVSTTSLAGTKSIAVHTSKDTVLRRYAPDSVKFDDAKPSSLDQVKVGDQLRARGSRNADGSELTAEEIVTGAFRNIAGTISSIDPSAGTIAVADLITKKPVVVRISSESQVRKLPAQMAQAMAIRLKGGQTGNGAAAPGASQSAPESSSAAQADGAANGPGAGGGRGAGGGSDLQQLLSRVPAASLSDLQKGDAVMIVSTEGTASGAVTAITLVSGVEPILQASPNGSAQGMILPPWSLDSAPADAGGQ